MSTWLFTTMEDPGPALSLASSAIIVGLLLIATSLLATLSASLLAPASKPSPSVRVSNGDPGKYRP